MKSAGAPQWAVVGVLALAGVLVALQGTLLVPLVSQLPEIYDVSPVKSSWIITSTLLAGALATPIVARLADMFGKRRMVLVALGVMVAGSLLLATTDEYAVGVAGRALQGFAAALLPVAMSIMKEILPPQRVGSGIALVGATLGIGSAVGLPLAGLMYGSLGWRSLFWMTAVLGSIVAVAAWWILPRASPSPGTRERFDWLGALLLLLGLTPLLLVIAQGNEWGWGSAPTGALSVVAVAALAAFLPWELRTDHPLINLRLAAHRPVVLTNVAAMVIAVGMLANLLIASQQLGSPAFVDGGFGLSAGSTGLAMAAPAAVLVLGAPLVGRLLGRYGGRRVLILGALVMAASYLARVFLDQSVLEVVIGAVLVSIGTSLTFSAMPMIIMSAVPPGHTASANGVNSLCRMIGTSVSTAGIAALTSSTSVIVNGREYPSVQTNHSAFFVCSAAALAASVLAWFIPRHRETARGQVWRQVLLGGKGLVTLVRSNNLLRSRSEVRSSGEGTMMNSHMHPTIDASVHIFFSSDADLRSYLREPFASRGFPEPDVAWFAPPGTKYAPGTANPDGSHQASDPEVVGAAIFEQRGFDYAILHPMSGGVMPDRHLGTAILSATNEMMVERWLDSGTYADKFRGTIRVNPNDIESAVREIKRWQDHPRIVQIGLPLQTQEPYGRPHFRPLWRAACDANLPVAVHIEMGAGITHPATPSGIARTYSHHAGFLPFGYLYHLMNMITEGVFEEFPDLKVVWADGAADMLTPIIWRMDTFGRPHLEQTPWAPKIPSAYLPEHVYFVQGALDGPGDVEFAAEWLRMTGKEDMVMFGSSYPDWQLASPDTLPSAWTDEQREKVLWRNADGLYGLHAPA